MKAPVVHQKAAARGLVFIVLGVAIFLMALNYPLGSRMNMGPGYMPVVFSSLLTLLGILNIVVSFRNTEGGTVSGLAFGGLAMTSLGVVAFAFLVGHGLLPAIFLLVTFSTMAAGKPRLIEMGLSFVILALIGSALFVFGLGQPTSYLLWR